MTALELERIAREMFDARPPEDLEDPEALLDVAAIAAIEDLIDVWMELWPDGGVG